MSKQSQKEAVFSAVTAVLNEADIVPNEGDSFAIHLNRELRARVTAILTEGFSNSSIALDKAFSSEADLRTYCSGLISNWLRKDGRMNGGVKYQAKNPGSRVGSSDTQLKAMRILLSTETDPVNIAEIQTFIDARVSEIKVSRKPAKVIDYSALPAALAEKYSL